MAQFLSTALFLAVFASAFLVIVTMLRGHADAILAALAGRSLKAAMLEQDARLGLTFPNLRRKSAPRAPLTRRGWSMRAAA